MAQRLKGQETRLVVAGPNGVEDGLVDVQSFEAELDVEILEEAFLGEVANRFDDIFNGVGGNMEVQIESRAFVDFIGRVQDRAQRRLPADTKFVITSAFALPNGVRVRLVFEDVFFGPIPIRTPSRKEYTKMRIEWKCSTLRRVG
jgi:hypothetical protein